MKEKLYIFKEIWLYLRAHKRGPVAALVVFFILLGLLLALAELPVLAPFIYPLF